MKALVVGGTGPTGPYILEGLKERGYEVTIYHRGLHEPDDLPEVAHHEHGDPFNLDTLKEHFASAKFDLVISMYGRLRHVASVLSGKTERFVGIGGSAAYINPQHAENSIAAQSLPILMNHPTYGNRDINPFGFAVANSERRLMEMHERGEFEASLIRYPTLYGPRTPRQWLWPIMRRYIEGRRRIIVPGDGSHIFPTGYSENIAEIVLLVSDKKEAAGKIFNAVDSRTHTIKNFIKLVGEILDYEWEIVEVNHPIGHRLAKGYAPEASKMLDDTPLKTILEYKDVVPVEEGIKRTVEWILNNVGSFDQSIESLLGNPYAYELEDLVVETLANADDELNPLLERVQNELVIQEFRGGQY
ncbi:MAG: Nucleoside-diphosphate-sugar epimerase [Chloroflexi bacterium]|jgi:nucleoside-diphosphate-sugar epimerase|nr:MAG: Nucleoside-diphosphate-sugar epimerase [Chloroflexota bacterium]